MEPIEVSGQPLIEQVWGGARLIAVAVGAWALGRGYLAQDTLALLGATGGVVWGVVGSQIKTWQRSAKLIALASTLPDHIARLK